MKRFLRQSIPLLIVAVTVALVLPMHPANAQLNIIGSITGEALSSIAAWIANTAMSLMSFLLVVSSWMLNVSLNLTLHIKEFVDATPAIYTTWRTIRDISGIFIIFFLIYAAIQLIIGVKKPNWNDLIKNVVIAGVLINFSFFITGLGIDASNIVSMQIYNAIAPTNGLGGNTNSSAGFFSGDPSTWISHADTTGLATIFMNSLKIQTMYKNGTFFEPSGQEATAPIRILIAGVVGSFIMFAAAASFSIAAAAFLARFVVLIFLLAFSPIAFLFIVSQVSGTFGKQIGKWWNAYKSMLLFMPIYLLLMYLALNVLSTSSLFGGTMGVDGTWYGPILALCVNAAIVIFLINLPLMAASDIAGETINFMGDAAKRWGTPTLRKGWQNYIGSTTVGRAAYAARQSTAMAKLSAKVPIVGQAVNSGLSSISKSGFGGDGKKGSYEARLKARGKAQEDLHKQIGTVDETLYDNKIKDSSGQTELDRVKAERRTAQSTYRANLPWRNVFTGKPGGVIGFMVDNRASRQTSTKLEKEAAKADKKDFKSKLEKLNEEDVKQKTTNERRLEDIDSEIRTLRDPRNITMGTEAKAKELEDESTRLKKENRDINRRMEDRKKDIEVGKNIENEEKEKKNEDRLSSIEDKVSS